MNDLARLIDRMNAADRASAAGNPVKALRILMGWTCSQCLQEFTPKPEEEPMLAVKLTMSIPIIGPCCADLPGGQR